MTNREKINDMALYDLLCRMQDNADDQQFDRAFPCIIGFITGDPPIWRCAEFMEGTHALCYKCIAAWLNEECDL